MSKVLVTRSLLEDIGDAIRAKNDSVSQYSLAQMPNAIESLPKASVLVHKSITQNGTYDPANDNADGYDEVSVNVPNTYTISDEGKVVSSGGLVSQTSRNVTENGTYDTTENNEVTVSVASGSSTGGSTNILSGTEEPTSQDGSNGCIYLVTEEGVSFTCDSEYLVTSITQLLSTQSAAFYKTVEGPAIAVHYMWSNIYGPILVSTNPDYVKMTQNTGTPYSVELNGVTWYMSTVNYFSYSSDNPQIPTLYTVGLDPQVASNRPTILEAILQASNAVLNEGEFIKEALCKVNGIWNNLIGTDIEDVNLGQSTGGGGVAFIVVQMNLGSNETAQVTISNGTTTITGQVTGENYIGLVPSIGTWTISATKNGTTDSKTITISEYPSISNIILFMTENVLKQMVNDTSYLKLSNAIGDGANFNGRYFTRTSDEPVIFMRARTVNSSYWGYGVITINENFTFTNNSYGDLVKIGSEVTAKGTIYYAWVMTGMWSDQNSPTYTLDNETVTIPNTNVMILYQTFSMLFSSSAYQEEFENFIDLLADLYLNSVNS